MLTKDYIIPSLAVVSIVILLLIGPVKQEQSYHRFADQRNAFAIPNFLNVITNLPFIVVGVLGLLSVRKAKEKVVKLIFRSLFIGFLLLTLGSGYYHLFPNDQTLVFDRIPIVIVMMGFFAFIIYDYIDKRSGYSAYIGLNIFGVVSVLYWAAGDENGNGDLRWYGMAQFFPVIAIPIILLLYRSRYNISKRIIYIFLFFTLAKLFEMFDKQIYNFLENAISGHSLKHVFMAIAGYEIVLLTNDRMKTNV